MWLVLAALRRPLTVLVAVVGLLAASVLAIRTAPVDIFPDLGVPVIYVVQPFAGMSPAQMEGQIVGYYEYHFLYINGIEHIESQSIQGMAMLKLYFHPGTNIAQSLAQVTAMAFRATSFMPPGTLPPFIVRFDAGSIPVGQLVFSSERRGDAEIQDLALYKVRPILATLPGVSAPPPSGGKVRTIVVYADPERLRAYHLSPDEVATTLARGNLTLPAGNVRIGGRTYIAATNAMVQKPSDLEGIPLRTGAGPTVFLRDVARVEDSSDILYNIALVNGRRTVYMPLTKRADASTLDVVNAIKAALPKMRSLVPDDIHISFEFDQSVYVTNSLRGLLVEGIVGAVLTALVVLLFLRDWRSSLIVVLTIPFAVLGGFVGLRLAGQTANLMTLGGLALAIGILVDEATVAVENIHTHLGLGQPVARGVVDGMREVMLPRLLAMLCVIAVFIPSSFMVGIGRALFPPLALAVAFSMIASFLLSTTLVPVLTVWLLREAPGGAHPPKESWLQNQYARSSERTLRGAKWVLGLYALACIGVLALGTRLGTELFPQVDTGQFQMRIRAPDGTQLEKTEEIVRGVDRLLREVLGPKAVKMTLGNIGNPPWTYPVNGVFVWNSGPHEALLLVALEPANRPKLDLVRERLRQELPSRFPGVRFSFEPGDIVSQVLNFGAPAAINVTISGNDLTDTRAFAEKVRSAFSSLPSLQDVQIPQALDYPTLNITIDRELAGQQGVSVDKVGRSIVAATSSSVLVTPNFWTNPATGVPYRVALRVPENQITSIDDLRNLPVMQDGSPRPLVGDIASVSVGTSYGEIDHFNSQRALSVIANVRGSDLGKAAAEVRDALQKLGSPPKGISVALRGQVEQMESTLSSLRGGLALAVLVVFLLLTANFQSIREPLLVLSTVPGVLAGVALSLLVTGSTLNVQSLMGAIMAVGVSVANALLLITFARERRKQGDSRIDAARAAAKARMRPILMTSIAMMAGMAPMALGLGEGGEQSAPLGRAVLGGLFASTVVTLLVLPALYSVSARKAAWASSSLDPDDSDSRHFSKGAET